MRNSDIIFLGTLIGVTIIFILSFFVKYNLPYWFNFWWVILLPIAIFKNYITKNKFSRWLNKE